MERIGRIIYETGKVKALGVRQFPFASFGKPDLERGDHANGRSVSNSIRDSHRKRQSSLLPGKKGLCAGLVTAWRRTRSWNIHHQGGLAEKYNKSAKQICLRYEIQRQVIPLPKASTKERMVQNYQVFDFEIEKGRICIGSILCSQQAGQESIRIFQE
ncbi:MAG: aldo/keto reductase [Dorea sp.]